MTHLYARLSGALLLLLLIAAPVRAAEVIPASVVDGAVVWTPSGEYAQAVLTLSSPSRLEYRRAFGAAEAVRFHPSEIGDVPLADGFYAYELVLAQADPETGEPRAVSSQKGTVEVRGGLAVPSELLDFVINDDLIVDGSACVGFDCVNGESFGFDTLRLKENNLRIRAFDTSSTASFPSNDWEITFNETTNGGLNKFSITDITGGRVPFTIEAGAPSHSLYVDDGGRIGLGTSTPVVEVHIVDGDTPTVRLEQDGSSGFTPQTWDVAGNETNFFVRDATNGSLLPLRIRPGAPSNSIFVDTDGDVGLGTSSPTKQLDVFGGDITIRENAGVGGDLFVNDVIVDDTLKVNGRVIAEQLNVLAALAAGTPGIRVTNTTPVGGGGGPLNIMTLEGDGDLFVTGSVNGTVFNPTSDVNRKQNFAPVDVEAVLDGVVSLPISTWEFIGDADGGLHLGPMAQDFKAAFGLGAYDTRISTVDADGVALASIQALHGRAEADAARIAALEAANAALEARLARLEALLGADHE